MARVTKQTTPQNLTNLPVWRVQLPVDRPCQIYPRVSSPGQKNNISVEMQKDKQFAISCGWTEHMIVIDNRDLGVSGQVRMEDRLAFAGMNWRIISGEIGAVVVAQVDRLFRDKWGVEYRKFMELCERYGVLVVTVEFVYDFSVSWHVDRFRRKCEEAWNYIDTHVLHRMLSAREYLSMRGFWCVGNIPVGYTVDRSKKYKKFLPYPTHAEALKDVFLLFRDCGGVLMETYRRVKARPIWFPAFDESVDEELVRRFTLSKVTDDDNHVVGYTFGSFTGLRSVLVNPVYIGVWIYKGQLISYDNHEAIIDKDLFYYAFNMLSPTLLDGSDNPKYAGRKTYKKMSTGVAFLSPVIESGSTDKPYIIYPTEYETQHGLKSAYKIYLDNGGVRLGRYSVDAEQVDRVVIQRLVDHMLESDDHHDYQDYDENNHVEAIKKVKEDITSVNSAKASINKNIESGKITNLDVLLATQTAYTNLEAEERRLQEIKQRLESQGSLSEQRKAFKTLMREVGEYWEKLTCVEDKAKLVELFIERVVFTMLSSRFYSLEVTWVDGQWLRETALCMRDSHKVSKWEDAEDEILREHYPHTPTDELMRMLPDRTLNTIRQRAGAKGLRRSRGDAAHHTLTYNDLSVAAKYSVPEAMLREVRGKGGKYTKSYSDVLVRWYSLQSNPSVPELRGD